MGDTLYDIAIIGGGINGTGIARDAAGRGLRVILFEQHDLAAHTSSASTKLIHGGLRYLEHLEFSLVRKALIEREVILRIAPHITWPLRFIVPHDPSMRPAWMMRAGLFLYDHLAKREQLPDSETVNLREHPGGVPLKHTYQTGFIYSDGWVDDARLVVLNALDAHEHGARICTYTQVTSAQRQDNHWELETSTTGTVRARAVVNAAGPWAGQLLTHLFQAPSTHSLRLVKGSHIVVPKLFHHPYAYLFQNSDGRIIFAIPYEQNFTLIGTTDVDYDADPANAQADADEITYLCDMASHYFQRRVTPSGVVHSYSGIRALVEDEAHDPAHTTRDYLLEINSQDTQTAPLLSVLGGKITTYRRLAEEVMTRLAPYIGNISDAWTHAQPLPGGEKPELDADLRWPWLPPLLRERYARTYGTRMSAWLHQAQHLDDLGPEIAPHVYEAELRYTREVEFARSGEDFLWRRTKLGLHLNAEQKRAVHQWFAVA